jgi:hypothetical protein
MSRRVRLKVMPLQRVASRFPVYCRRIVARASKDIPQEMRELAVKNIDQARAAYSQLMDAAQKAQAMMKALIP